MAYVPDPPPADPQDLPDYIQRQLLQISIELGNVETGAFLKIWKEAPPKPREGHLAVALGAPGWDPGAGKGLYEYRSGTWQKL